MAKRYLASKNKWKYIWIAFRNLSTPSHVYDLAHGSTPPLTHKESGIMYDLRRHGILK